MVRWVTHCCGTESRQGGAAEANTSLASFGPAAPRLDRAGWAHVAGVSLAWPRQYKAGVVDRMAGTPKVPQAAGEAAQARGCGHTGQVP